MELCLGCERILPRICESGKLRILSESELRKRFHELDNRYRNPDPIGKIISELRQSVIRYWQQVRVEGRNWLTLLRSLLAPELNQLLSQSTQTKTI